jgi:nucleoside-triphosphatase THEP1
VRCRCLRFCQRIGADKESFGVSEDHLNIMQVAYLRAAFMEYVAIEEVWPIELVTRGLGKESLRILDSDNAMLILLRELRHLQLHLVNTSFDSTSRSVVLRTIKNVSEFETAVTILTIPTADLRQLKTLRNAACFDPEELERVVALAGDVGFP